MSLVLHRTLLTFMPRFRLRLNLGLVVLFDNRLEFGVSLGLLAEDC